MRHHEQSARGGEGAREHPLTPERLGCGTCYADRAVRLLFTKLSDARHRLEVRRADGSAESFEFETRSVLLHDLVHYAVEGQAGFDDAFWGRLAAGATLAELADGGFPDGATQLGAAESLVGQMQALFKGHLPREAYVARAAARYPEIVDGAFVDGVLERLRRLTGHWGSTAYGASMELVWPPADDGPGA